MWWPYVNSSKASAVAKRNVLVGRNCKKMMVRILGKTSKLFHFCTYQFALILLLKKQQNIPMQWKKIFVW